MVSFLSSILHFWVPVNTFCDQMFLTDQKHFKTKNWIHGVNSVISFVTGRCWAILLGSFCDVVDRWTSKKCGRKAFPDSNFKIHELTDRRPLKLISLERYKSDRIDPHCVPTIIRFVFCQFGSPLDFVGCNSCEKCDTDITVNDSLRNSIVVGKEKQSHFGWNEVEGRKHRHFLVGQWAFSEQWWSLFISSLWQECSGMKLLRIITRKCERISLGTRKLIWKVWSFVPFQAFQDMNLWKLIGAEILYFGKEIHMDHLWHSLVWCSVSHLVNYGCASPGEWQSLPEEFNPSESEERSLETDASLGQPTIILSGREPPQTEKPLLMLIRMRWEWWERLEVRRQCPSADANKSRCERGRRRGRWITNATKIIRSAWIMLHLTHVEEKRSFGVHGRQTTRGMSERKGGWRNWHLFWSKNLTSLWA